MGIGFVLLAAALTVPPAGACSDPPPARPLITAQPWAQRTLDPAAVWPFSTGAGVTVAVVDSGVDTGHPQLRSRGAVLRGQDFDLAGDLPGTFDCDSHGTAVASIVAARPAAGVGFAGLAPGATILPVRVSDRGLTDEGAVRMIDPNVLARGIWYAADHGATVMNLSLAGAGDNPRIRDAIRHAVARDVLVVAAAGNGQQGLTPEVSYPAAYPGVLGVGAVDENGQRLPGSQIGPQVDLVAPGGAVIAATRAGGHQYLQGTSFAAPFVTATAALVRSAWPELTAPQVAARILATATPAPGGRGSRAYGAGLVNPYRAVTDGLTSAPAALAPPVSPLRAKPSPRSFPAYPIVAVAVCLLLVSGRALLTRRNWRPRRAAPLPEQPATVDVPVNLF
ncbi:type VII secretion-associated serine protease mycosin [Actinoplanes sp. NPDC049265]|uniref:type VII secretion-associated serine protease mycosin n=1 Tax=Actinoplanes sp. NPDC049265 TaxID=3363902 RepID=UPI00371F9B9A